MENLPMFSKRIVVRNPYSVNLVPSEIVDKEFIKYAHEAGAYIYLVLVGPRVNVLELINDGDQWIMHTEFHDGASMKPRTVPVSFDMLPQNASIIGNLIEFTDEKTGERHRTNAVKIVRNILAEPIFRSVSSQIAPTNWEYQTLRKFFTYRVEYIGQSYGNNGSRTAAERIGEGHSHVQAVLAEINDYFPNSAVALIVMGVSVDNSEMHITIEPDDKEAENAFVKMFTEPNGPLDDEGTLVTTMEAMLIRSFPGIRNKQYTRFAEKDAPSLVGALRDAGYTHVGVELDVTGSVALLQHPDTSKEPNTVLRFDADLTTGESGTFPSNPPLTWQLD
ncbi:hypothetical protein ACTXLS_10265 [Corynebacterium variabile]